MPKKTETSLRPLLPRPAHSGRALGLALLLAVTCLQPALAGDGSWLDLGFSFSSLWDRFSLPGMLGW